MLYLVPLEVIGVLTEKGYKTVRKNNTVDEWQPETWRKRSQNSRNHVINRKCRILRK